MRRLTVLATAIPLALAACGGVVEENAASSGEAGPDAATATEAELAADAQLAGEAARAEAEDAAIGGTVSAEDVSAAGNVTVNGQ